MFIFTCALYLRYYVIYYIHILYIVYTYICLTFRAGTLSISFGRKTYTCILKRDPLLYGVSEVRFHQSTHFCCSFCRPHPLVFLVRLRHCNKSKQIPCIISRPAVTDSKRRRVIFHSVHQSCCMNIHIHIYAIIVSRFHSVPESGTRVITTSSLKMILFLQKKMLHGCVYFSPVLDPELCYFSS